MMIRTIKPGDFLEVTLASGYGYLRYVGKYRRTPIDVFQILQNDRGRRIVEAGELFTLPTAYLMTTVRSTLTDDPRFRVIKGIPLGRIELPTFRQAYGLGWHLLEGDREIAVRRLDDVSRKLPILEAALPDQVVDRIEHDWRPEHHTLDATEQLAEWVVEARNKGWKGVGRLSLFAQIATKSRARAAETALKASGYDVKIEPSSSGAQILKTATPPAGVDVAGPWADEVEADVKEALKRFGASIIAQEIG
jgi:hypothetical protein